MKCINEVPREELRGKRVLVRAGLDLPVNDRGEVTDAFRVKKSLATLLFLKEAGAKTIILTKIGRDPKDTNEPVAKALRHHLNVLYVPDIFGHAAQSAIAAMRDGEFLLLENLQQDPGEVANDMAFAKHVAGLGDIYVNDCFPSAHRESAGMTSVPKLMPSYAGIQFCEEVARLSEALNPPHPAFAIIGGAKFETKIPVINLFLQKYDHTFITGALANDVFKAQGLPVGRSRISDELPPPAIIGHPRLIAPNDVTTEQSDGHAYVKKPHEVVADDKIVDIGPDTVALIAPYIERANFILWNGPTGLYEGGYLSYTHAIAEIIARRIEAGAQCIIGGGDTIAALQESGIKEERLGFLSTGGGAMLEYLIKGTLPAIEALA
ncbi:MAG TPA: phosphoglycerate kinase [Candidatus Paceibacterota bacterium]|nr:phosphoglycerate kinase [Candidatus Paceibacterota bacterium]